MHTEIIIEQRMYLILLISTPDILNIAWSPAATQDEVSSPAEIATFI